MKSYIAYIAYIAYKLYVKSRNFNYLAKGKVRYFPLFQVCGFSALRLQLLKTVVGF